MSNFIEVKNPPHLKIIEEPIISNRMPQSQRYYWLYSYAATVESGGNEAVRETYRTTPRLLCKTDYYTITTLETFAH